MVEVDSAAEEGDAVGTVSGVGGLGVGSASGSGSMCGSFIVSSSLFGDESGWEMSVSRRLSAQLKQAKFRGSY